MSLIKLTFACFLLTAAAAVFAIAFGYEQAAKPNMELCKHQYALCTSALCIPFEHGHKRDEREHESDDDGEQGRVQNAS